jgi:predicted SAM-dependent methyltransferase
VRKLQIGSSSNVLNGWFNTDLLPFYNGALFLDATELFPFEDNTFDYIFSEHMIEHITYKEGLSMLRECYRVLKPGGKIRIATPDLEIIAGIYAKDKSESQKQYIKSVVDMWLTDVGVYQECFVINQIFGFGHEFIYDYQILKYALETVGFVKISRCEPGESNEEVFQNIDIHKNDYIKFETMVLEAKRPHERIGQ